MGEKHALLAASKAHRWIPCTRSARCEETIMNSSSTSIAAEEGTAAHALAEYKVLVYLRTPTNKPVSKYDSPEMEFHTDSYLEYACELIAEAYSRASDSLVLVEKRIDYSDYAPEGFGTSDLIIVSDGVLDVLDFKFGRGRVSAEDNPQLKLYALGALDEFGFLYDIKTVRLTIHQPRLNSISTFELTVEELIEWAEKVAKPRAALAFKGEGDFVSGDHCHYCRAGATCRERAESNLALAKLDFKLPDTLTDEEVTEVLTKADELSKWATEVWKYAEKEALAGRKEWNGFKLIESNPKRKYGNEEKVAEVVIATGEYREDEIYKVSLIGITEMTKLLGGKKQFEELLGKLAIKPKGKPSLARADKKQKVWNPNDSAKVDFADEDISNI